MNTKAYCAGTLTEAGLRSRIVNSLRRLSLHWKPKTVALNRAKGGKRINPLTGKEKTFYVCEESGESGWLEGMHVDHIEPVVPSEWACENKYLGYDWNEYLRRMFVEADGYRVITKELHKAKTKAENEKRKSLKKSK